MGGALPFLNINITVTCKHIGCTLSSCITSLFDHVSALYHNSPFQLPCLIAIESESFTLLRREECFFWVGGSSKIMGNGEISLESKKQSKNGFSCQRFYRSRPTIRLAADGKLMGLQCYSIAKKGQACLFNSH